MGRIFVANKYNLFLEANKLEIPILASTEMQAQYFGFSIQKSPDIKHFIEDGDKQTTVLATVKNYGRMFPYISSIIMCLGILFHMLVMVFFKRTGNENAK